MKTSIKIILYGVLGTFAVATAGVMYVLHNITLSNVFETGVIEVPKGISDKGSIAWDANAIAHIKATNERDAYFLLGYSHARDRLWQTAPCRKPSAPRRWKWINLPGRWASRKTQS